MSVGVPESGLLTLRRLWRRAPAWRMVGLLAVLLTVLCVVFPPHPKLASQAPAPEPQASFTPPPQPAAPLPATPPPVARAPVVPKTVAPPAPANPPQVHTANLSLATPNQSSKTDGLNDALAGNRFSGSLRVDGFNVPLPPGEWLQLASARFEQKSPQGDKKASGELLMLGRVRNRRLTGYIRITAARSATDPGTGFVVSPGCEKQNEGTNILVQEAIEPFGHEACWLIEHSFLAPLQAWADRANKLPALERAAFGDLAAKGVTYPAEMVNVRFTRAEQWGLLEVRYGFSPEEDHIASTSQIASYADSDWQPTAIGRYPDKVAYINKLKTWGEGFWPKFKAAFDASAPASLR